MVAEVIVRHAGGSYPVRIAPGLAARFDTEIASIAGDAQTIIITDATVERAWPDLLPATPRLVFPAGEGHKTRETWQSLTDQLLGTGIDRHAVVIALGGGVTGDLAGFVAATTLRGLRWIAIPTTLLAMVDASVGGKTGVDTSHGKNLVGAFHAPQGVLVDPALLATLPAERYREGFAEAVKHAVITDARHVDWLEGHAAALLERDVDLLAELVRASVTIKGAIVASDEHEGGERAVLNAGHTAAHAIEQVTGFAVTHGDAVAIGLVAETRLGEAGGIAEPGTATRVASLLARFDLPTKPPSGLHHAALVTAMRHDKKNRDGTVHAALLAGIGRIARGPDGEWTREIDPDRLADITLG